MRPEDEEDDSPRLGITRVTVQQPLDAAAMKLLYSNRSNRAPSPIPISSEETSPSDEGDMDRNNAASKVRIANRFGAGRGTLSKLRGNGAMLDDATTANSTKTPDNMSEPTSGSRGGRFRSSHQSFIDQGYAQTPPQRRPSKIRSNNDSFNKIFSMFESRPKTPIVPPSESWQYEG